MPERESTSEREYAQLQTAFSGLFKEYSKATYDPSLYPIEIDYNDIIEDYLVFGSFSRSNTKNQPTVINALSLDSTVRMTAMATWLINEPKVTEVEITAITNDEAVSVLNLLALRLKFPNRIDSQTT